mgnify:CR=1 FL=1
MSGKTTVLKDLVRKFSDGLIGSFYKCAVIDERGELSCLKSSECFNADILSFYPKPYGIMTAVRTFVFPTFTILVMSWEAKVRQTRC